MKITRGLVGVAILGLLTGCTGKVAGAAAPALMTSTLAADFAQIPPSALGVHDEIEFLDSARYRVLAAANKTMWQEVGEDANAPLVMNASQFLKPSTGIDLSVADSQLSVGTGAAGLALMVGGQNQATIEGTLKKSGWTGGSILKAPVNAGMFSALTQIRPVKDDVIIGGPDADLGQVESGAGSDDEPYVLAALNCLGDVVAAIGVNVGSQSKDGMILAGVRSNAKGSAYTSVFCFSAGSSAAAQSLATKDRADLASKETVHNDEPWTKLLPSPTVEVIAGDAAKKVPYVVRISSESSAQSASLPLKLIIDGEVTSLDGK